ncbi:MAG: hypothetical protein KDB22_00495 [Planctomycetales bacterium]|nr:hypothetical protein [Planctomycetales bacterium]
MRIALQITCILLVFGPSTSAAQSFNGPLPVVDHGSWRATTDANSLSGDFQQGDTVFTDSAWPATSFGNAHSPAARMSMDIGTMGLIRERPNSQVIALNELAQPILNASELQGSMQFGLRAFVDFYRIRPFAGGTDFQFGYFGINSLDAETTLASVEVSPIFFNSVPIAPESTSNIIYSSNLYSGETNLRFLSSQRIRPIAGLRFLKLEDTYDAFNQTGAVRTGGFSITNNSLFGGQFGCDGDIPLGRFCKLIAAGKLGVVHNAVDGAARAADPSGTEVVKNFSDSSFTTMLDAHVGIHYNFAGPLSFRAAYQVLHVDKVALGIDQNQSVRVLSPGETVAFNSQQWHGLNLSAIFEF